MASCTEITNLLQAYVDGELGASEQAILKLHIAECAGCKGQMRNVERTSAVLFEAFSKVHLAQDLSEYTLDHLPDMDRKAFDAAGTNLRAKHPSRVRERFVRLLPVAAAVLILFMAAVMNKNWPAASIAAETLGIVSYSQNGVSRIREASTERENAGVKTFVMPGDRYETAENSELMLLLLGPTKIRIAENTRVLVHDDRKISLEKGRIFLDVAKDKRLFKVLTPTGEITVFGTSFDVHVESDRTTVVVEEGKVQLVHAQDERVFGIIKPGQAASVEAEASSFQAYAINVQQTTAWARHIVADDEAEAIFTSRILSRQTPGEVSGRSGYYVQTLDQPLKSIILEWEPGSAFADYSGYELYVYDDHNEALFRSEIHGSVFSNPAMTSYEIENTGNRRVKLRHIFVKLVPLDDGHDREVSITSLNARIGS